MHIWHLLVLLAGVGSTGLSPSPLSHPMARCPCCFQPHISCHGPWEPQLHGRNSPGRRSHGHPQAAGTCCSHLLEPKQMLCLSQRGRNIPKQDRLCPAPPDPSMCIPQQSLPSPERAGAPRRLKTFPRSVFCPPVPSSSQCWINALTPSRILQLPCQASHKVTVPQRD